MTNHCDTCREVRPVTRCRLDDGSVVHLCDRCHDARFEPLLVQARRTFTKGLAPTNCQKET